MYALIVWVNDDPIQGSVVKMTSIVEPRLPLDQYKEGQEVKARCQGYGIFTGVIGKIADHLGRKDLMGILADDRFSSLVDKILKEREVSTPVGNEEKNQTPESGMPPANKETGKKKKNKEDKNAAKKDRVELERAANELELTELQASLCTQRQPAKDMTELQEPSQRQPEKGMGTYDDDQKTPTNLEDRISLPSLSSTLRQSLDVMHGTGSPEKAPANQEQPAKTQPISVPAVNGYVEQQINALRQELYQANARIAHLETSYTWLWNYVQQMQCNVPVPSETAGHKQNLEKEQLSASCSSNPDFQISTQDNHSDINTSVEKMIGGYTMDQLQSKVIGITSYSKMAIVLFRFLYKEEEYAGKSLTGKASKSGEKRPPVDQEKLTGIYDIIQRNFPHVTPVMVREKLRDIVKPSRANKTAKK
ncbi:uncharacterized protein LOC132732484 [Ruditapes philippinarum]|uniref:uncharacterized protein LOC132732484 n=1 Tax=Ruditapes philippinarum TaxID=129788 RepID=UPI00295B7F46|nr:uncharacterized protein LOC132732484 [Ruditapes philippinarum]